MVEEYYDNIMIYDIDLEKKKQLHVLVNHYFQRHCGDIVISYRFTQTNHGDISPTKRMNPDDFYYLCRIAIIFKQMLYTSQPLRLDLGNLLLVAVLGSPFAQIPSGYD